MMGSRNPIFSATSSTMWSGAMPPTMSRTGSPGTTRSKVKMMSDVMKTMSTPCTKRFKR